MPAPTPPPPPPPIVPGRILQNHRRPDLEDVLAFVYGNLLLQVGKLRPQEELPRVSVS